MAPTRTPGPSAVALVLAAGVLAALAQHVRLGVRRTDLASPGVDAIALTAVYAKAHPPDGWADLDPPGQLSEFFSERPRRFARTDTWLAQRGARGQQHMRLQSLKNVWTDYTQSGDGVKCVCDSAAAGDPEMEGIDPNVKPACTCTGGRTTQFTNTEEGGPLDTGGHGAWPQELPGASRDVPGDGAAYIDGIVGNNAYKAALQALAAGGDEVLAPNDAELRTWHALVGMAERAVAGKAGGGEVSRRASLDSFTSSSSLSSSPPDELPDGFIAAWSNEYQRKYFYNVATGESSWEKPQTAAIYPKLPGCWTAVWSHEEERYYFDSTTGEITWEKPDSSACPPEEVDDARWRAMHEDARATAADRNLIEEIRRNYRTFLAEAEYCDQLGDYCEGRLCRCKRRVGRHLCYKMNLLWQDDCKVASEVQPCQDLSVTEVQDMCTVMEKLPGVNVDHWIATPNMARGEPHQEAPTLFFAPEGVYE